MNFSGLIYCIPIYFSIDRSAKGIENDDIDSGFWKRIFKTSKNDS